MPMNTDGFAELAGQIEKMANRLNTNDEGAPTAKRILTAAAQPIHQQMKANASNDPKMIEGKLHGALNVGKVHGCPAEEKGLYRDLLLRDKQERKTYVVTELQKGVQEAILTYQVQAKTDGLTRVRIQLQTGRTHQIRAQFSGRGMPLAGDRKYSLQEDNCEIALWSYRLAFSHPTTGSPMEFVLEPPEVYPWTVC